MSEALVALAADLGAALSARGWRLTTAESCTGGLVASLVTEVAGSSAWFERGFVTYANEAKVEMLGVRTETLAQHGAVSEACVEEMAVGALARSHADIAVAISGIAGPSGGTSDKPVGTVCLAWATLLGDVRRVRCHFDGDRAAVREQAAALAMQGCLRLLTPPDQLV